MDHTHLEGKYHKSNLSEYKIQNDSQRINLSFPTFAELTISRLKRTCMKIDHCQIEYRPMVPHNASGNVQITIHDTRMNIDKTKQAEYKFPINTPIKLNFYSASYFSTQQDIPWVAKINTTQTDINTGTTFCKIKARLKLSTEKHSAQITHKPPSVELLSDITPIDSIDFTHVDRAAPTFEACTDNTITMDELNTHRIAYAQLTTRPGSSFQQTLRCNSTRHSNYEDTRTTNEEDRPSTSMHQRSNSAIDRYVHLTPGNLGDLIKTATAPSSSDKPL